LPSAPDVRWDVEAQRERVLAREGAVRGRDLAAPRDAELLPQHVRMRLHGPGRDPEPLADLVVRAPSCDECDDLLLALGERERPFIQDAGHDGEPASRVSRTPLTEGRIRKDYAVDFVACLATAEIGETHNQYAGSALRRRRLREYLARRRDAPLLLVGEAAGYRGARVSGLAFTSERQLTGSGPAEASATIVHRTLEELGIGDDVLLWNLVPTHPHHPGAPDTNRRPTRAEIAAARPFLEELARGRRAIGIGRLAERELGPPYVRHPSHGGAAAFRATLLQCLR